MRIPQFSDPLDYESASLGLPPRACACTARKRFLISNSRVNHADAFARWALLGYGNDYHLVHHIYPNIPHYHLREAQEALMRKSRGYRDALVQTVGVFRAPEGQRSLLASLQTKEVALTPSSS